MNNGAHYNQLRESSWRRTLTEAEQAELRAHLAAHPEAQADWEAEAGLNELLSRLPDAPVSSNFTARVLQSVEREAAARGRPPLAGWAWGWRGLSWMPKAAAAMLVVGLSLLAYQRHQVVTRVRVAESLVAVADVRSLPTNPEILKDFEAIRRLSQTTRADEELLALLK